MPCTLTKKSNNGADFSDCDFSNKDLSGYDFSDCNLRGTNFSGCIFDENTNFSNANFGASESNKATNFAYCDLTKAAFSEPANFGAYGTDKVRTNLVMATVPWRLFAATLQYLDLTQTAIVNLPMTIEFLTLESVTWQKLDFSNKVLINAHFTNCDFTDSNLKGANLNYSSFIGGTNLTNTDLSECSLLEVVFDGSTMTKTNLSYASHISSCSFMNTLLKGTIFDGNDLRDSSFSIPAKLSTDPAFITSFQFATLSTDFLMNNLVKNWQCMDLRNTTVPDFKSIVKDLSNLQAQHSYFNNTLDFTNAMLNGSNFFESTFNSVTFSNAKINNCNLEKSKTIAGNMGGPSYAIFKVSSLNTQISAEYNYTSLLKDLTNKTTDNVIKVFAHFNYVIDNITLENGTDPISKNPSWRIKDRAKPITREFMVVKTPIGYKTDNFELIVYDNSPCRFSFAHIISSFLQSSDFSNSVMDNVQLYGSFLSYANLSHVNFTGAQLGKNAAIFSISKSNTALKPPYNYTSFLKDLEDSVLSNIINIFKKFGYHIERISITVSKAPPQNAKAAWIITDNSISPSREFLVAQTIVDNSEEELDVYYEGAAPTVLDYSYMPSINFTQANLTGCSAQGCSLYDSMLLGSSAILNRTVLIEVSFVGANLYGADFTKATVNGIDFTNANLMNAKFDGVNIGSSTSGKAVTFEHANLQGANFTKANITDAILLNAAICLPISPTQSTKTNGVWLADLQSSDPDFKAILNELNQADQLKTIINPPPSIMNAHFLKPGTIQPNLHGLLSQNGLDVSSSSDVSIITYSTTWKIIDSTSSKTYLLIPGYNSNFTVTYNVFQSGIPAEICEISYNTTLNNGQVSSSLSSILKTNSNGKITLSEQAELSQYQRPVIWRILDAVANKSYTLWWGVEYMNRALNNVTYIRSSTPSLHSLFGAKLSIDLRAQSFFTKTTDPANDTTTWLVDMGVNDAFYLKTGYIQFKIIGNSSTNPTAFSIFGFSLRMSGLDQNQNETIMNVSIAPTIIDQDIINNSTLLPNNQTKLQNVNAELPFDQWIRIYKNIPSPPKCVPTPLSYCPAPTTKLKY